MKEEREMGGGRGEGEGREKGGREGGREKVSTSPQKQIDR